MLRIVLWALLAVLCFVWMAREARIDAKPIPADLAGYIRKDQKWMLAAFVALLAGIALTG